MGLFSGVTEMSLAIWIPAMLLLGIVGFALLFAFVPACDKV